MNKKDKELLSNIFIGLGLILIVFIVFYPIAFLSFMPSDLEFKLNFDKGLIFSIIIALIGVGFAGIGLMLKEKLK